MLFNSGVTVGTFLMDRRNYPIPNFDLIIDKQSYSSKEVI